MPTSTQMIDLTNHTNLRNGKFAITNIGDWMWIKRVHRRRYTQRVQLYILIDNKSSPSLWGISTALRLPNTIIGKPYVFPGTNGKRGLCISHNVEATEAMIRSLTGGMGGGTEQASEGRAFASNAGLVFLEQTRVLAHASWPRQRPTNLQTGFKCVPMRSPDSMGIVIGTRQANLRTGFTCVPKRSPASTS